MIKKIKPRMTEKGIVSITILIIGLLMLILTAVFCKGGYVDETDCKVPYKIDYVVEGDFPINTSQNITKVTPEKFNFSEGNVLVIKENFDVYVYNYNGENYTYTLLYKYDYQDGCKYDFDTNTIHSKSTSYKFFYVCLFITFMFVAFLYYIIENVFITVSLSSIFFLVCFRIDSIILI